MGAEEGRAHTDNAQRQDSAVMRKQDCPGSNLRSTPYLSGDNRLKISVSESLQVSNAAYINS